ncbi:trypsin-like peptidase domain-containing protein [Brevibacillus sp. FIR094]|uniref:trypsin-like peptidase domain-containing protein n=1 Tax=Brevibacillus sp. FIR094 TaxID=3134809 RepID=UPI003D1EB412
MKKQADKQTIEALTGLQEKLVIQSKPPVQPKPWSEIEKLAKAASVHIDIGFGGTGVLLKGGLLLTAKHVSKGRVSFRAKTYSRDWLDATLVAEHPGIGKDAVDLSLYKIQRPSAKLPFLSLSAEPLVSGQKLLTVEAEYTDCAALICFRMA